jgi:hypothetical protein
MSLRLIRLDERGLINSSKYEIGAALMAYTFYYVHERCALYAYGGIQIRCTCLMVLNIDGAVRVLG